MLSRSLYPLCSILRLIIPFPLASKFTVYVPFPTFVASFPPVRHYQVMLSTHSRQHSSSSFSLSSSSSSTSFFTSTTTAPSAVQGISSPASSTASHPPLPNSPSHLHHVSFLTPSPPHTQLNPHCPSLEYYYNFPILLHYMPYFYFLLVQKFFKLFFPLCLTLLSQVFSVSHYFHQQFLAFLALF